MTTSTSEVERQLEPLLFGWHHVGIRAAGVAYPFGGFLLVGSTIDVLAGLAYNPDDDSDGRRGRRYTRFVHEYFPPTYARLGLGRKMWSGQRSAPLHYFQATVLLVADGQPVLPAVFPPSATAMAPPTASGDVKRGAR